jgi:hypothetical protein
MRMPAIISLHPHASVKQEADEQVWAGGGAVLGGYLGGYLGNQQGGTTQLILVPFISHATDVVPSNRCTSCTSLLAMMMMMMWTDDDDDDDDDDDVD